MALNNIMTLLEELMQNIKTFNQDDYRIGRSEFYEWSQNIPGVTGFEYGSVKSVGLSDLDLAIIVDKNTTTYPHVKQMIQSFPQRTKRVMNGGTLMIFNSETVKYLRYVDDINIKSDRDISNLFITLTEKEKEVVKLIQIFEWFPERILKIYSSLSNSDNLIRQNGYYYSLGHTVKKINHFLGGDSAIDEYLSRVNLVRHQIEKGKKYIQLYPIAELLELMNGVLHKFMNYLDTSECIKKATHIDNLAFRIRSNEYLEGWADINSLSVASFGDKKVVTVPSVFLLNHYYYSKFDYRISETISRDLYINPVYNYLHHINNTLYKDVLNKRIKLIEDNYKNLTQYKFKNGLYKYGWYLPK